MRKYSKYRGEPDTVEIVINLITWLVIIAVLWETLSINPSTESVWNDGVCSKCDERFVVVKAHGSTNWYACPSCDQEVKRFIWFGG